MRTFICVTLLIVCPPPTLTPFCYILADDWGSISQNSLAKIESMLSLSKMRAYDSETTSIKNDVARLERFLERGSSMPFGVVKGKVEVEERHVRMGVKEVMRMGEDGRAIGALAVRAGMSI